MILRFILGINIPANDIALCEEFRCFIDVPMYLLQPTRSIGKSRKELLKLLFSYSFCVILKIK